MKTYKLEVKKVRRSFAIVYGVAVLANYKTEEKALQELNNNSKFFEYWANSASVSYRNRIAGGDFKIINCK